MPLRRSDDKTYTLGTNLSANSAATQIPGGEYLFTVDGTIGGATVSLQVQMPNGTWTDVSVYSGSKVSATALPYGQTGIDLPACNVRVGISGGTPSGINGYLSGLG